MPTKKTTKKDDSLMTSAARSIGSTLGSLVASATHLVSKEPAPAKPAKKAAKSAPTKKAAAKKKSAAKR